MENRVYCLYRVSTEKQVDYNEKSEADIPMQRRECHKFADHMGWTIVHEEQEEGVSGHKVRAERRDKVQLLKKHAKQGRFDILLVFMFDRLGRIADETPFVLEWFVKNGIRVWSTQEGEQRFESHTDKLTNYIRFWQADGESEKTSIRVKTSLGQMVEDGYFKGGFAPYGYDFVKSGRINKRKHECYALAINDEEAAIVRIMFDKYVHEGYGAWRIATYLNEKGIRNRAGKCWHQASIRGILCNLTYTGVLRCSESRSEVIEAIRIIDDALYQEAQNIRARRSKVAAGNAPTVPMNTRGQSLLSGNVFCGHCGSRLTLTTNGKYRKKRDGTMDTTQRIRYVCYGKTRKQTECDGQTGYTMHILDDVVDKVIRSIFERMQSVPGSDVINAGYRSKMAEFTAIYRKAKADLAKAQKNLDALKAEVIKSITGESSFSTTLLSDMVLEAEAKLRDATAAYSAATINYEDGSSMMESIKDEYTNLIEWASIYDTASHESKKMIVACLINRVEVYRDYKIHIDFNIDFEQFNIGLEKGLDVVA